MRRFTGWDVAAGVAVGMLIGMLLFIAAQEQVRDGLDRITRHTWRCPGD